MKAHKKFLLPGAGILAFLLLAAVVYIFIHYYKYTEDFLRLRSENYDTVFFSMYPIDHYEEGDFEYYRAKKTVKSSVPIEDTKALKVYMDIAVNSKNAIHSAYLGIDPEHAHGEDVLQIVSENPNTMFEILLAYPAMEYWTDMEEDICRQTWEEYCNFAKDLSGIANVRVYYFGNEEWLVCNPGNYADTFNTNVEVSELLMCYADELHNNILTNENFQERFGQAWELIEKYRTQPLNPPEASGWEVIFFGDSVIGNYTDSLSIPGVVEGLTKADVYNCGYGGKGAALSHNTLEPISEIVEAFIRKDVSGIPAQTQAYAGIAQYIREGNPDKEKLFVINYGLNDYFDGIPVTASELYDVTSYSGALRTAVEKLQEAYPEAEILLMTPNRTINFEFGEGVTSEKGGKLQDYADALISLGEELQVRVLDNFRKLPVQRDKHWELLADDTHPNGQGRFLIGIWIVEIMQQILGE